MVHLLLFPLFAYLLIGLHFAVALCLFLPQSLVDSGECPDPMRRLVLFPLVWLCWPRYAKRLWSRGI